MLFHLQYGRSKKRKIRFDNALYPKKKFRMEDLQLLKFQPNKRKFSNGHKSMSIGLFKKLFRHAAPQQSERKRTRLFHFIGSRP